MPFPKTCFSPLQIFPKRVGVVASRSRGPKPAAKIDHVTNVVVGSCWWRRVFLLHRMASHRIASPRVVSFRFYSSCWLPLADAALLAACCQVRLKRTFDWFGLSGGSETERERERQLHVAFWWKKDVFLVSVIFLFIFLVAFVAFVVVLFPQSPLPACESENATKCSEL